MDYSKVTFLEYMKEKKAIMDSLGRTEGNCVNVYCEDCPFTRGTCSDIEMDDPEKALDIIMNYEYPVDWTNVAVDTPIFIRDSQYSKWEPRYFAKYENGRVNAWSDGRTSFTARSDIDMACWNFAKLKDPEV